MGRVGRDCSRVALLQSVWCRATLLQTSAPLAGRRTARIDGQALTCESSRTSSSVSLRSSTGSRSASCSVVRALAIGATTVDCAASHAERHRRHRHLVPRGDLVEHREHRAPAVVEVRAGPLGPRAVDVRPAVAVLAGQEALREPVVGHARQALGLQQRLQRRLELRALDQVVVRLQRDELGQPVAPGDLQRAAQPLGGEVRRRDGAHLARADERVEGVEVLLLRHVLVVVVGVVEVDAVRPQPAQRVVARRRDVRRAQSLARRQRRHLGRQHDVVAAPARREPLADDRLGLAARVAGHPPHVGVGGVDEVPAACRERVEHGERGVAVGRPAEDVGAQAEPGDLDAAGSDGCHTHRLVISPVAPRLAPLARRSTGHARGRR